MPEHYKGVIAACFAFTVWGFFPLYWNWLAQIDATTIVMHRVVWSFFFVFLIVLIRKRLRRAFSAIRDLRTALLIAASAVVIALNWGVFIWAVANGYTIEASLGYFINPLISVLLGVVFFKDRLSRVSVVAVLIAFTGVLSLLVTGYGLPYIGLFVAVSFGIYGVLKKLTEMSADQSLLLESAILLIPALIVIMIGFKPRADLYTPHHLILLICGGLLTLLPLMAFSFAAQRITLSSLGMLQYIGPSIQLLVGITLLGEIWSLPLKLCFTFIWIALSIFSVEQLRKRGT